MTHPLMRPVLLSLFALLFATPVSAQKEQPYKPPNLNPSGVPSGFVAEWGDYYLAAAVYAYENGIEGMSTDGWLGVGMGFGDSRRLLAVEIDLNLESLADFDHGGSLDVRLGRQLIRSDTFALQLGAGWLGIASYGTWPRQGGSKYGIITAAIPLRPQDSAFRQTLQVNLGGGDGRFQRLDALDLLSTGLLASIGVELTPNIGLSAGWAGRGLNSTLSVVPIRGAPLYLGVSCTNLTNVDETGRAVAFTLSWGSSFRTANFD